MVTEDLEKSLGEIIHSASPVDQKQGVAATSSCCCCCTAASVMEEGE